MLLAELISEWVRSGQHNIRPAGRMRPARSFLAARENSVAENVAKARLRIITCPFRISSTLWRNRLLRPSASLCWSIWPFELSELCRPALRVCREVSQRNLSVKSHLFRLYLRKHSISHYSRFMAIAIYLYIFLSFSGSISTSWKT